MRRATSCKYMSTTPTVSVMESKMGENMRKKEQEIEAANAKLANASFDGPAVMCTMVEQTTCRIELSSADQDLLEDPDELIFGMD